MVYQPGGPDLTEGGLAMMRNVVGVALVVFVIFIIGLALHADHQEQARWDRPLHADLDRSCQKQLYDIDWCLPAETIPTLRECLDRQRAARR
jgi:hypothetical protein